MISIKPGVNVRGLHDKIWEAIYRVDTVYNSLGVDTVITAGLDGKHKYASLHYVGCAVDLRTRHLSLNDIQVVYEEIMDVLDKDYDVVLHKTHIHVEYQPKTQRGL